MRRSNRHLLVLFAGAAALALAPAVGAQRAHPGHVGVYTNPVWAHDFPDPFVLRDPGTRHFFAYATQTGPYGFQVMESTDLVHWMHRGTAFRPPWSNQHFWAPEVIRYRGRFYMTYSARNRETGRHDIGVAVSDTPTGPFKHLTKLVVAPPGQHGVIDSDVLIDRDGTPYLTYSEEDPRRIVLRRMAPDMMRVAGDVTELVRPDREYEHGVTEAPTLILRNGIYHLFFSCGYYQSGKDGPFYRVSHAWSRSLRGPYTKDAEPVLQTVAGQVYGPGHQCVIHLASGDWWMLYHGWDAQNEPRYGSNPLGRTLRIDRLVWLGDHPVVTGPTTVHQIAPNVSGGESRESSVESPERVGHAQRGVPLSEPGRRTARSQVQCASMHRVVAGPAPSAASRATKQVAVR